MNKLIALLLICVTLLTACKEKQEDVLANIRKNTTEINGKLKDWTKRSTDDLAPRRNSSTRGVITGYFRDDEIKKIEFQQYTDSFRVFTEYYFMDGMLSYVVRQMFVYNAPASYTEERARANNDTNWYDDKKTVLQISRYYFQKNKLIKWIDGSNGNEDVPVNSPMFATRESAIWAEAVVLLKELKES